MCRVYTILVLTEDALTAHDAARIAELHGDEPVRAQVLVALDTGGHGLVDTLDEVVLGHLGGHGNHPKQPEQAARQALAESMDVLEAAGVGASGSVSSADPVDEAVRAAAQVDEVLVVTQPHIVEEGLRRDWASRIRDTAGKPVLHIVAGTDRVVS